MYHIPRAPNTYHTANPNAQNIHTAYPPVMYPPPYFTFSMRPAEDMVAMRFQKREQSPWGEMGSISGLTTLSILEFTREQRSSSLVETSGQVVVGAVKGEDSF